MAKTVSLDFPLAGVDRRWAVQRQPPYSTPDALNVRPEAVAEGRTRGGSRPGMDKAYQELIGLGHPMRMLNSVTITSAEAMSETFETFEVDDFQGGALSDAWSLPGWNAFDRISPVSYSLAGPFIACPKTGAVYKDFDYDTTEPYTVEMFIQPVNSSFHGNYFLYVRMNDASPNPETSGVTAKLVMRDGTGAYSGTLSVGGGATYNFTGGTDVCDAGWFSLLINGNIIRVYWRNKVLLTQTVSAQSGTRMGFGLQSDSLAARGPRAALIGAFRTRYFLESPPQQYHTELVASGFGQFWYEDETEHMIRLVSPVTLANDRQIMAQERAQRLYIADYADPRITGTGTIDDTGLILDDTDVTDWTDYGISVANDVVVISDGTGAVVDGTYQIDSLDYGALTLTATAGGAGTCSYRIERAPKVWNPITRQLSIWTATPGKGQVPTGCPLICLYMDCIVLAGAYRDPQQYYISRSGDPLDWYFGSPMNDAQRAVSGGGTDIAGKVGAPILGMASHTDNYLVFFCNSSTYVMRGHPAVGGSLDGLSYGIGIVDKMAWCKGPEGQLIWLSHDGLFQLEPGAQSFPQPISTERLPDDLKHIDRYQRQVTLLFNEDEGGIHIYLTPNDAGEVRHWWYDWRGKGFWPMTIPHDCDPTVGYEFHPKEVSRRRMLIGGRDGYIRRYHRMLSTDDGEAISSHVLYGPLQAGAANQEGLFRDLYGDVGRASGNVTWNIYKADSAEEVLAQTAAAASGVWTPGSNHIARPRVRGNSFVLKLSDTNGAPWELEGVEALFLPVGSSRK